MTEPTQTTALAIPQKMPVIARIVHDVIKIAADLLHKIGKRTLSDSKRREMIESHIVPSPSSPGVPFIAQVIFGGERVRVGSTLTQVLTDGAPQFGEDGRPLMAFAPDYDISIVGKCELPDPKDPSKRVEMNVWPVKMCNESGSLIPYVNIDETGHIRAGQAMHCLFVRDFDPKTGEENGRVRAVPLGLAKSENISLYNSIVDRLAEQDSRKAWEKIRQITSNFGRAVRFLTLKPSGNRATQGLTPVWKSRDFSTLDPAKCDYWIVARLGGKAVTLSRSSQPIILKGTEALEQIFRLEERWNSIEVTVWGLPGEIGDTELRELDQGETNVDWLNVFGVNLYSVHPRSGASLLRNALKDPPIDAMISIGLLSPGGTREMATETLKALSPKVRVDIESTVRQALKDLIHNLGGAGRENPSLSLEYVLGGEPTGELLEQALNNPNEDNLLVTAILASATATNLGLEVWDPKCWILVEAYKALLLEMASSAGVELPLPPEPDAPPAVPPLDTPARTEDPASSP